MGYEKDCYGNPIENIDQIIELRVQDIVISENCGEYLLRTAQFIDDELTRYYDMDPFYNVKERSDLIGHLVAGLAPHTSAGVLGRIVGFTKALGCYAHPYFHSAKRRNCDSDEDAVMLLLDALNGKTVVSTDQSSDLLCDLSPETQTWMSHTDYIAKAPAGFKVTARTPVCPIG